MTRSDGFTRPSPIAEPQDSDAALASELRAVCEALGHLEPFHVREPDLDIDTRLARRILRDAAARLEAPIAEGSS